MNKQLRKAVIAGNWKMNKTPEESKNLIDEIIPLVKDADCKVIVCTPYVDLYNVVEKTKNTNIEVGAQNCHWENEGAFTGEISANMLMSMGVNYTIIGHSERRAYFGETDETVNKRIKAALKSGLNVILCVGEQLEHRKLGITFEVIGMQIKMALNEIEKDDLKKIIIAYEPVWAIGTGKTATADQANQVCGFIRKVVTGLYNDTEACGMSILYGGSMNAKNANELLSKDDIDGGLIGGASLKPVDFSEIVKEASK